jgi:hypothetical protein
MRLAIWVPALFALGVANATAMPVLLHGATSWQHLYLLRIVALMVFTVLGVAVARSFVEARRWFGQRAR